MAWLERECTTVGMMSGTSLDGIDLCCVRLSQPDGSDIVDYQTISANTIAYTQDWTKRLEEAPQLSGEQLLKLHVDYGHLVGTALQNFISSLSVAVDLVACHGHTVFHQPQNGFTFQLGEGETIASYLDCILVCNFRSRDVAYGGQGAPLAPNGEKFLFPSNSFCVNLGGIANISAQKGLVGYDICPCNMILNHLAGLYDKHMKYDKGGNIARGGEVMEGLLSKWNDLPYYRMAPPKSLAREWFENDFLSVLSPEFSDIRGIMRTAVEHIAHQVVHALSREVKSYTDQHDLSLLVTGGGALNTFLIQRLNALLSSHQLPIKTIATSKEVIEFKEAIIFALLGWRTVQGRPNVDKCVTGARKDSVAGSVHLPDNASTRKVMWLQ